MSITDTAKEVVQKVEEEVKEVVNEVVQKVEDALGIDNNAGQHADAPADDAATPSSTEPNA